MTLQSPFAGSRIYPASKAPNRLIGPRHMGPCTLMHDWMGMQVLDGWRNGWGANSSSPPVPARVDRRSRVALAFGTDGDDDRGRCDPPQAVPPECPPEGDRRLASGAPRKPLAASPGARSSSRRASPRERAGRGGPAAGRQPPLRGQDAPSSSPVLPSSCWAVPLRRPGNGRCCRGGCRRCRASPCCCPSICRVRTWSRA